MKRRPSRWARFKAAVSRWWHHHDASFDDDWWIW